MYQSFVCLLRLALLQVLVKREEADSHVSNKHKQAHESPLHTPLACNITIGIAIWRVFQGVECYSRDLFLQRLFLELPF